MRRFLLRWWAESCLVIPLLTCGCQHSKPCQATCCDAANAVMMGAPVAAPVAAPAGSAPAAEAPAPGSLPVMPGASMRPSDDPTASTAGPTAAPLLQTAVRPALPQAADPMLSLAPPPYPSAAASPAMQQSAPPMQPENQPSGPAANEEASEAPAPRFGHDPSYRWLVGTVDYCRIQQAWLLRYVPVEEDDRYGGCVTLLITDPKMSLKPGQTVRVEGALIDPDSQQLRPAFQVQSMRGE